MTSMTRLKALESTVQMMSLALLHMLPAQPATTLPGCCLGSFAQFAQSGRHHHTPLVSPPCNLTACQIFHVKIIVISRPYRHQHGLLTPSQRRQSLIFRVWQPSQAAHRPDHAYRIALHDLSTRIRTLAPVSHITSTRTSAEEDAKPYTI